MYPDDRAAAMSGFRAHLIGPLASTVVVDLATEHGRRTIDVVLPRHPLPDWPTDTRPTVVHRALNEMLLRHAPDGPIIALGTRGHDDSALEQWRSDLPDREVLGVDVHPGPGVDVVGDAHMLSRFIAPGSVAVFLSDAVFEHLEAPWLVAAEVQRILKVGGLALVSVPSVWPQHAAPNDFWRMSPFGLRSLFGPNLGFTVLTSGGFGAVSVVPGEHTREAHSSMPVIYGPSMAYVLARKDRDLESHVVEWPYDPVDGLVRAQQYPVDCVETGLAR
jgi:hypothetical protein